MFQSIREFWALATPFRAQLSVLVLLLALDAILTALSVVTIAPLADLALERPVDQWLPVTAKFQEILLALGLPFTLFSVAAVFFVLTLSMAIFSVFVRYVLVRLRVKVLGRLIDESLTSTFQSGWGYFAATNSGLLINTYVKETANTGAAFMGLALAAASLVRIAAFVAVPIMMEPLLVSLCLVAAVILILPFMYLGKWSTRFGGSDLLHSNRFTSLLKESLASAREVISFGRERRTLDQINTAYRQFGESRVKSETFSYFSSQIYEPLGILVILGVLVVARDSVEGLALSSIAAVLWGLLRTLAPLKQLIQLKHSIDNRLPSLRQIMAERARAQSFRQSSGTTRFEQQPTSIEFDHVSFSYGEAEAALHDVSLQAGANQMVALVGESGSGKSTLVDLVLGLQQPDQGVVLLNGISSTEVDLAQWRSGLSVVPQRPVLFDLTIRENLLWANPEATEQMLEDVCQVTESAGFIARLPDGLDTPVGDAGVRLSGGQVQRLALARALVRQPSVLVLDEATSALDTETESRIYRALPRATANCLVIVVAHRLATVRSANRILVFRSGNLVEQGTYDQLEAAGGYFHRLLHSQPTDENRLATEILPATAAL